MVKNFKIIKRKIKYLRLEIKEGNLNLILPFGYQGKIDDILKTKNSWLEKKFKLIEEIKNKSKKCQLKKLKNFNEVILKQIKKLSAVLKVKPKNISFRMMKRRWASCSLKGKIIFNKLMKFLPEELIFYVVVHEMCHLLVRNHKREFWFLVKKFVPDFSEKEKLLSAYQIKINQLLDQKYSYLLSF